MEIAGEKSNRKTVSWKELFGEKLHAGHLGFVHVPTSKIGILKKWHTKIHVSLKDATK